MQHESICSSPCREDAFSKIISLLKMAENLLRISVSFNEPLKKCGELFKIACSVDIRCKVQLVVHGLVDRLRFKGLICIHWSKSLEPSFKRFYYFTAWRSKKQTVWPRHAKAYLRAYADSERPDQLRIRAV